MKAAQKKAILNQYPNATEVYETTDGLIHLSVCEANIQASHLDDKKVKTHKLKS